MQRLEAASTELARSAAQARTGSAMPLRSLAPRSSSSNRLPSSFTCTLGDDDRVRLGDPLQACRKVRGLADDCLLLRRTTPDQIADHDQPSRDAHAYPKRLRIPLFAEGLNQLQPSPYRTLGIVLMGLRVAKVLPGVPHFVEPLGPMRMQIEFYDQLPDL